MAQTERPYTEIQTALEAIPFPSNIDEFTSLAERTDNFVATWFDNSPNAFSEFEIIARRFHKFNNLLFVEQLTEYYISNGQICFWVRHDFMLSRMFFQFLDFEFELENAMHTTDQLMRYHLGN